MLGNLVARMTARRHAETAATLSVVTCVQICAGAGMVYVAAGGSCAGHPWSL
jgi:hypothetical protein